MTDYGQQFAALEQFECYLREFLSGIRGNEQLDQKVVSQTDLFAAGLLDSLRMVELVASLEEHLQVEIPLGLLSVRSFRTPELMWTKVVSRLIDGEVPRDEDLA